MKLLMAIFILSTLASPITSSANDGDGSVRIEVVPSAVSAEDSYRAAENVKISLSGLFPNFCYQPVATQVSQVRKKILITDTAMVQGDEFCSMAMKPYRKPVDLGKLSSGEYELYINEGGTFRPATKIHVE